MSRVLQVYVRIIFQFLISESVIYVDETGVTVQLTIQNRQAAVTVVPSASSLVIRALKGGLTFTLIRVLPKCSQTELEPPRDRKKDKKH